MSRYLPPILAMPYGLPLWLNLPLGIASGLGGSAVGARAATGGGGVFECGLPVAEWMRMELAKVAS